MQGPHHGVPDRRRWLPSGKGPRGFMAGPRLIAALYRRYRDAKLRRVGAPSFVAFLFFFFFLYFSAIRVAFWWWLADFDGDATRRLRRRRRGPWGLVWFYYYYFFFFFVLFFVSVPACLFATAARLRNKEILSFCRFISRTHRGLVAPNNAALSALWEFNTFPFIFRDIFFYVFLFG